MRLFAAIVPPPAAVAELARRTTALRPSWPELRWTSPGAWHVTLAFFGEVPDRVLAGLSAGLERAAGGQLAQEAAVRGCSAFPAAGRARVVWAGLQAEQAALEALAAAVAAAGRQAGALPREADRGYRPHVTLAYLRRPADVRPLTAELADLAGSSWIIGEIHLIRSHPGGPPPGGPRYESLAAWPLRGQHG